MIGKILLAILLVILALLALALTIPIHIRAAYDRGDLSAHLRYGPFKIALFPRPEEKTSKIKKQEKKK